MDKVELLSDKDNCLASVDSWTLSTQPNGAKPPAWARETDEAVTGSVNISMGVLKLTNLNLMPSTANGVELCIKLRPLSRCPSLEKFCYSGRSGICKYAVFDK